MQISQETRLQRRVFCCASQIIRQKQKDFFFPNPIERYLRTSKPNLPAKSAHQPLSQYRIPPANSPQAYAPHISTASF